MPYPKRILFTGLFCLFCFASSAQFKRIADSLENVLQNGGLTGVARIDLCNKLASYLSRSNTPRAKALAAQALAESIKTGYREGEGGAYFMLSFAFDHEGVLDSTLYYADKAAKILPLYPKRVIEAGVSYMLLGSTYRKKQQSSKAIANYLESVKYFEKAGYKAGIADGYVGIAIMFVNQKIYDKAIEYHLKALAIYRETDVKTQVAQELGNLGIVYTRIKQYPRAINYQKQAITLAKAIGDTVEIGNGYNSLGETYVAMQDYKQAITALQLSAEIRKQAKIEAGLSYTLNHLGLAYEKLGDKAKAIAYMKSAHKLALKLNNPQQIQDAFESMSAFYAHNRQLDSAYYYSNKGQLSKDSMDAIDNKAAFSNLLVKYETEKKVQQINLLSKQNTIQQLSIASRNKTIGIIVGIFLLIAVVAGLLYNQSKLKQKAVAQRQMLDQQDVLTKAVIEAEEKERRRIASDLHDGVGQLFSAVKMNLSGLMERVTINRDEDRFLAEKTMALVDESCKEVRVISHQMMPNMLLRSGIASDVKSFIEKIDSEKLKINVEASGFKNKLESNVEIVLYRVIQETVNNVIKHSQASHLSIILNKDAEGIYADIIDDGVGFDTTLLDDFTGIGLKNIATRIEYLKGTVKFISAPGAGTSVKIWVPV